MVSDIATIVLIEMLLCVLLAIACVVLGAFVALKGYEWYRHRQIPKLCSSCGSTMVNAQWCEYETHWVCIHCSELLSSDKSRGVVRGCYRCRLQREQKDAETHPRQENVRLSLSGYVQDAETRVRH